MHITINTIGTRGDVQPYVALGKGLQQAGHRVMVCTHRIFEDLVQQHGLDMYPVDMDPRSILHQEATAEIGHNALGMLRWQQHHYRQWMEAGFRDALAAAEGADLLLNSNLAVAAYSAAEKLKLPALVLSLQPGMPTREFHNFTVPAAPAWLPGKELYNYTSTRLVHLMFFGMLHRIVNDCRESVLDLPPLPFSYYVGLTADSLDILQGFSPTVVPKPHDWNDRQCIAGYWFLEDKAWKPPADLLAFLEVGPPPVYVGFVSTVEHEAAHINQIIIEALDRAGQRGIVSSGWSDLGGASLPDSIYRIDYAPHEWLFPQMAAVVHHGGAGTTGAGLRAGVPNVVVPFFADQPFWAWRVQQLGAGPQPIPRKKLTAEGLAFAIRLAVEHQPMRARAAEIGAQIRAEDGIGRAVQFIEQFAWRQRARVTNSARPEVSVSGD